MTRDGGVEGVREREVTWDGGVEEIGEGNRGERFHSGSGTGDSATGVEGIREVVTRDGGVEEIGEEVIRDVGVEEMGEEVTRVEDSASTLRLRSVAYTTFCKVWSLLMWWFVNQ